MMHKVNLKSEPYVDAPVISQEGNLSLAQALEEYSGLKEILTAENWKFHVTDKINTRLDFLSRYIADDLSEGVLT